MKKILFRLIAIAAVVALGYAGYRLVQQLPQKQREVATTEVIRGDVVVKAFARGELQAVRQMSLTAPNLFGTVQVTALAPLGAFAREGDLVVEFDDAEVLSRVEEKQLELDQIAERIKKAEADLAIRTNQDEVELLRANYSVRRAELEVQRNELLSAIDAQKNTLNLDEAGRRLKKLESDIQSRRAQAKAELAVLQETRQKAELEMQREQQRLGQVKLLSPMNGLVAIRQARSHFFFAGSQMPDIREGDELRPGMPVADILDLSELEVLARVGELDRANLNEGQDVVIRLDALPERQLRGKIKNLSGTASADPYSNDPEKKFDVTFQIDMDELLTALRATPEQIAQVKATAEQNRQRAPSSASQAPRAAMGGGMPGGGFPPGGGMPGGGMQVGGGMSPEGMQGADGAPVRQRPSGRRGTAGMDPATIIARLPEEQKKKAQETLDKELDGKKWAELTPENKQEIFGKLRPILQQAMGGGGGAAPNDGGASNGGAGRRRFSEAQIAAAKLPPAPEEDSELDVLLRPGLLADVEIIVELIPDSIHVPVYAVFEKNNEPVVYVKNGNQFEERVVKPLKRSESTMVIASGLEEGEIIALADPTVKPSEATNETPPAQNNPMGGFGGGGNGGGAGRGR